MTSHPSVPFALLTVVILVATARVLPWGGPVTKWLACLIFLAEGAAGLYVTFGGHL